MATSKPRSPSPSPKLWRRPPTRPWWTSPSPSLPACQYKVSAIQLSGYTNVFPVEKLRELIHLQPGQTANAVQADQDVEALKKLYGTRGYMGVQIHPHA